MGYTYSIPAALVPGRLIVPISLVIYRSHFLLFSQEIAASLDDTSVICIELYSWNIYTQYPLHVFQYKRKVLLDFRDIKGPHNTHSTLQVKEGSFCKEGEGSCRGTGK